jgi:uroporphyrinogen decarboxylase
MSNTQTTLTSRERVRRAVNHEDHDRVPRFETFWHDTIERWLEEGLPGKDLEEGFAAALEALDSDMLDLQNAMWMVPFPNRGHIISEDEETKTYVDGWGAKLRSFKHKSTTPEHLGWECDSPEAWHEKYRPAILEDWVRTDVDHVKKRFEQGRQGEKWCYLQGTEPFEALRKLLGDETSLMAMLEEPEWIVDICEVTTEGMLRNFQMALDAGVEPDMLWIYGDMAYNHATMCSPQTYKELIWPSHKRLTDWAHERGMKFLYHTDGDVRGVMDLYVEAGFDVLQPLESKANMDIRELIPRYGQDFTFCGNVDIMKMVTNDLEVIEQEIRGKLEAGMSTKGYIYHSDHSVPPQVSWATYQKIIEFVELYGNYG